MTRIVFSHGNSFPAATYRVLLERLRQRGFEVSAIDRIGHDPHYPVTGNWPHLVRQLTNFAAQQVRETGSQVFLVGHSMGGLLSLMTAAQHPELVRGLLLLDSPLISGWRAVTVGMARHARVAGGAPRAQISRQRRNSWASNEEALDYFRKKKAFARWDPQVLQDYIQHGLHDEGGRRVLGFDRDVETDIYSTVPQNFSRLLRQHPLSCPVAAISGRSSVEMRQAGMALTQRITAGRTMVLDGGHLFPMERPLATAAAIEASLLNLASLAPSGQEQTVSGSSGTPVPK